MLRALRLAVGCFCAGILLFLPVALHADTCFAPGEEYTFYCGSASSEARTVVCRGELAVYYRYVLGGEVKGESTVYAAEGPSAAEILASFEARLCFSECVAGTTGYYCYSAKLGDTVRVNGYAVNLHVVVRADGATAVGTPLVFGGF